MANHDKIMKSMNGNLKNSKNGSASLDVSLFTEGGCQTHNKTFSVQSFLRNWGVPPGCGVFGRSGFRHSGFICGRSGFLDVRGLDIRGSFSDVRGFRTFGV